MDRGEVWWWISLLKVKGECFEGWAEQVAVQVVVELDVEIEKVEVVVEVDSQVCFEVKEVSFEV